MVPEEARPSIIFRDGPTGRRAALLDSPDIWEVIQSIDSEARPGEAAAKIDADLLHLTKAQVQAAVQYYAACPDEIDERIRRNVDGADAAEAAWRNRQAASTHARPNTKS